MPFPLEAEIHGSTVGLTLVWGFDDTTTPITAITGFVPRSMDLKFESEVNSTATDGEGHVEAIAISQLSNRKITATLTGYITSSFDPNTTPITFSYTPPNGSSRFFMVTSIGVPYKKGDFTEVTVEAVSYALVTA